MSEVTFNPKEITRPSLLYPVYLLIVFSMRLQKISGIPKGIRTPVTAVKGRCPRPLDDRDTKTIKYINIE